MANVTYDALWRQGVMELLDLLEAENPEDPALVPKDLSEWSCVYIGYVQTLRKLEAAYDQMVHPQKRQEIKKAVEACMGRMLEVRTWLVGLNGGTDGVHFDDILVDLKLHPAVVEVPIPRYFVSDRAQELVEREKFLETLMEKHGLKPPQEKQLATVTLPPLPEEDAIRVIQVNERGRQGRMRTGAQRVVKKQQALDLRMQQTGLVYTDVRAATMIQAIVRGYIWRKRVYKQTLQELEFIGMRPVSESGEAGPTPQAVLEANLERRKGVQAENQADYNQALVDLKQKVLEVEGQEMRESIQDKINAWFVENRDPVSGDYPEFPEDDDGGSTAILNPPPVVAAEDEEAGGAAGGGKGGKGDKGGEGADGGDGRGGEGSIPSRFIGDIEAAVQQYVVKWQDRDERDNFFQKHDAQFVKEELRPVVFEEVRKEVDEEMRLLLENLKEMVEAEKAARSGKKGKTKGKGKGKGKKGKGKKDKKKGKGKKDPTADRSLEDLYADLVQNKIVQPCLKVGMHDYVGGYHYISKYMEASLAKKSQKQGLSMSQVRQCITEYCILPLGSNTVQEKAPFSKAVLLYGVPNTGKTLLTHAIAQAAGASFFDLSPRNTNQVYPGKAVSLMVHMVFKVAKLMAPSVIYIDEVEKVFVADKKKQKEFNTNGGDPFNRIKKDLLKEMKQLQPGDGVLVVGNSSQPFLCTKKDEKAFVGFWDKHILLPIPDYDARRLLWQTLMRKHGAELPKDFDLPTLSQVSQGYCAGTINHVCRRILKPRKLEKLKEDPNALAVTEIVNQLCKLSPVSSDDISALEEWAKKLGPNEGKKKGK